MINAKEAKTLTEANICKDIENKATMVEKFVEETCAPAILEAIEERKFNTCVEVPADISVHSVQQLLFLEGYKVNICWGTPNNKVSVSWRNN